MIKSELKQLQLKIGAYDIKPVPTGLFALDGGAMFGTVPKVLWQKSNPSDELNRIPMEARALLLVSDTKKILIDTGNGTDFIEKYGEKLGSKFAEIYGVDKSGTSLLSSLRQSGYTPEDITDVILTHLHFDHAGGATCARNGEIVPAFPNATYHVQKSNLENALSPNIRERASYLAANFLPLQKHNVLKLVEGEQKDYLPGISLWVSNGHTRGHQVVIVEDDSQQLIYCGDVVPTSSHVRSAWIMGYDINPLMLIEEKAHIMALTQQKNSYLYFEHDPYCDLAAVEKAANDFQVRERYRL
jgi:glyoxylase-like metal-dependent hydrolase (beta-lactamase superfamily II)